MTGNIMLSPRLIALAKEAQKSFGEAIYMRDESFTKGQMLALDMLDILGKQIDKDKAKP